MKGKAIYISLFCIYIAAVFYLCLMKPDGLPKEEIFIFGIGMDKIAHLIMFLPYPILSYFLFKDSGRERMRDILIHILMLSAGIGLAFATEQLQALTQYRTFEINDIYADITGIAVGSIPVLLLIFIKR